MTEKKKKPRAAKAPEPGTVFILFSRLSLENKLAIQALITKDIQSEKEQLTEKLKLIEGTK